MHTFFSKQYISHHFFNLPIKMLGEKVLFKLLFGNCHLLGIQSKVIVETWICAISPIVSFALCVFDTSENENGGICMSNSF